MIRATTILFSLIILASCKSKQNLQVRPNQIDTQCKVNFNSKAAIISHYDTSGLQFNWIKIKANINTLKDQKKTSFTTSFRIRKDSLIYASITKAGIPFAKLLITKDSLKLIDLFHKKQKTGSFSELESLIGFKLPFNLMQKLLYKTLKLKIKVFCTKSIKAIKKENFI